MTNLDPFYSNPANAAMPYLQQIPGTITPYFQPYINAGSDALNDLIKQYSTLLNNPGAVISNAGSGYQQSPGYQYQVNQGLNAANSAAAAGGMLGTPQNQNQATKTAEDIANQDYQQYLNQALGLYQTGLKGEQGINQMGYKASDTLAGDLASNLQNEGQLAYAGQQGQNMANSSIIGDATSLATAGLSGLMGAPMSPYGATMGATMGMGGMSPGMGSSMGGVNPAMMSQLSSLLGSLFGSNALFGANSFFS